MTKYNDLLVFVSDNSQIKYKDNNVNIEDNYKELTRESHLNNEDIFIFDDITIVTKDNKTIIIITKNKNRIISSNSSKRTDHLKTDVTPLVLRPRFAPLVPAKMSCLANW